MSDQKICWKCKEPYRFDLSDRYGLCPECSEKPEYVKCAHCKNNYRDGTPGSDPYDPKDKNREYFCSDYCRKRGA